jgi:hypothetical protein
MVVDGENEGEARKAMTLSIVLPPEMEKQLRERAAQAGQTVEGFICQLVEREILGANGSQAPRIIPPQAGKTFDEIFAPLRREVEESGISDEELDKLLEEAREEVWRERKAKQDRGS